MKKSVLILLLIFGFATASVAEENDTAVNLRTFHFSHPSTIEFSQLSPLGSVRGVVEKVNGIFELDLASLDQPGRSALEIKVDHFKNKNDKKNEKIKNQVLEKDQYPLIRFVLKKAIMEFHDDYLKKVDYLVGGELEIRGIRQKVEFLATLDYSRPDRLKIVGQFPLLVNDFGIQRSKLKKMLNKENRVDIAFELSAE